MPGIVQVAYAVEDPATAVEERDGLWPEGPFVVSPHIELVEVLHRGGSGRLDHSSAYANAGNVMIELITVHSAEPVGLAAAASTAAAGLHHVARFADDLDVATAELSAAGVEPVLWARTAGGVRFAWFDTRPRLGHLLEVYEPHPHLLAFYERLGVRV
jgi:Glyoxalase/Bleomycin resistance protein/Dioxygenase superfamily